MFQQIGGLVEDLQTLRALKRPVLAHHALVLVRISQVRDIVAARATLVPALIAHVQGRLLRLCRMLLLVVLLTMMLLLLLLRLLLLLESRVRLEDDAVDGAAQSVRPWRYGVHYGRRGNRVLLPRLRHSRSGVRIQLGAVVGPLAVRIQGDGIIGLPAMGEVGRQRGTYFDSSREDDS